MRHLLHGEFKWILHIVDHWSKFNFAFPLEHKSASNVANALQKWIFPFVELPSILQSDNGREFVNKLIEEVLSAWPGQVQFVSGHPCHPQSQRLVEQALYTTERMISAKVADSKSKCTPLADWFPHIVCKHMCILIHAIYVIP